MIGQSKIQELPGVTRVIDTSVDYEGHWSDGPFGNAAMHDPPFGRAVHVTDDPSKVEKILQRGGDIEKSYGRATPEYGAGGLFVSATPQLWTGRASGKWEFLNRMTQEDRNCLSAALVNILFEQRETRYITKPEFEWSEKNVMSWRIDPEHYPWVLPGLADQPYNIKSWDPEFLSACGVKAGKQPTYVEVVFFGLYAGFDNTPEMWVLRSLRRFASGIFSPGGFISTPQLAIWKTDAIVQFGTFVNKNFYDAWRAWRERNGSLRKYYPDIITAA